MDPGLDGTRRLEVTHLGRRGWLFLPDLLGAISVKAAALLNTTDREGERHAIDLALLLGLLDDPFETREALATSDRQLLHRASKVLTATHPAWTATQRGTDARLALEILVQAP